VILEDFRHEAIHGAARRGDSAQDLAAFQLVLEPARNRDARWDRKYGAGLPALVRPDPFFMAVPEWSETVSSSSGSLPAQGRDRSSRFGA
jgi:hypothetical protein